MAAKPEQEPSIEEILASIRQIISDDDQPREADIDLSSEPEEKFVIPVAEPEAVEEPKSSFADVLELTNEIHEEPPEIVMDVKQEEEMPVFTIPEPEPIKTAPPATEKVTPFPPQPVHSHASPEDSIFSNVAAQATSAAFSRLVGNIPVEREENMAMYANGRVTLEDMVREMLKPMLRDWIDNNVPAMVERLVEKELEKLARQAQGD